MPTRKKYRLPTFDEWCTINSLIPNKCLGFRGSDSYFRIMKKDAIKKLSKKGDK